MFLAVKSLQFKKKKCKKKRRLLLKIFSERSAFRRKRFLASIIHIAILQINVREPRKIWAYEREEFWFSRMLNDERFSDFWSQNFRMKKETFDEIVQVVRPALEKRDTQLRRAIPIEKRVGVAIWRLATGDTFRSIAKTFAIGKSTALKITKEFCLEMKRKAPHYIKFPKTRLETSECIEKFRISTNCKIPQVVGAVDGTHVRISAPETDGKPDYFSRKQCHTITTQGVVGADLLFLDVATGFPGSSHDARNLRNTSLFRKSESREILSKPEDAIKS